MGDSKRKRSPNKSETFTMNSNFIDKIGCHKNLFQFLVSITLLAILLVPYAAVKYSVEIWLASGRETTVPHPAIGVHVLRCCDDLRDGKEGIVCVANT